MSGVNVQLKVPLLANPAPAKNPVSTGFGWKPQATPILVTSELPWLTTSPEPIADVLVILVTGKVVTVGTIFAVVDGDESSEDFLQAVMIKEAKNKAKNVVFIFFGIKIESLWRRNTTYDYPKIEKDSDNHNFLIQYFSPK